MIATTKINYEELTNHILAMIEEVSKATFLITCTAHERILDLPNYIEHIISITKQYTIDNSILAFTNEAKFLKNLVILIRDETEYVLKVRERTPS